MLRDTLSWLFRLGYYDSVFQLSGLAHAGRSESLLCQQHSCRLSLSQTLHILLAWRKTPLLLFPMLVMILTGYDLLTHEIHGNYELGYD